MSIEDALSPGPGTGTGTGNDTAPHLSPAQTQALLAEVQALRLENQRLRTTQERLQITLDSSLYVVQAFEAVRDAQGQIVDFTWVFTNKAWQSQYGDPVGKRLLGENPGVLADGLFELFVRVTETGVPVDHERFYNKEQFNGWFHQTLVKMGDGFVMHTEDISARKRTEQELLRLKDAVAQQAEDKYRLLFNAIDEGFCLFELLYDAQGTAVDYQILEVNRAFAQQTGRAGAPGRWGSALGAGPEPHWLATYAQVAATGQPVRFENYHAGTGRWYEVYASRVGEAGSRQVCAVFSDVTARRRAAEILRESQVRKSFLLQFSDELRPLSDAGAIQEAVTRLGQAFFEADRCCYGELIDGQYFVRHDAAAAGLPSLAGTYDLAAMPLFRALLATGQPLVVEDVRTTPLVDEPLRALCGQLQIVAYLKVPVIKNGETVGELCVVQRTPRRWTPLEVDLAQEAAERTWAAVERAKTEQALRDSEAKYRTLFDSIDEAFALLEMVVDEAGCPVDYRFLETNRAYERQTGAAGIVGKRALELDPHLEAHWLAAYSQVARTGESVRLENYHELTGRWYSAYASRVGGAGSRLVALVFDDITERKHQAQRQAFLLKLSDVLRPLTTAHEIQRAALQVVSEQLGLDRALFAAIGPEATAPAVQAWYARPGLGAAPPAARLALVQALPLGQPTVCHDAATDAQLDPAARAACAASQVRAFVVVPLLKSGPWVVSLLAQASKPRQWLPQEVALLEETAERTWAAAERAHADAALRRSEEQLRVAVDAAELGTWNWNLTTDEVRWNARHYTQLGLEPGPGPLTLSFFARYLHPDDRAEVMRRLQAATEHHPFEAEFRVLTAQGELRWMSGHGQATDLGPDGRVRRLSGVMLDVTERKHAEQHLQALAASLERQVQQRTHALRESQELQQSVFETVRNAITVFRAVRDEQGQITDFQLVLSNGLAERHLGQLAAGQSLGTGQPGSAEADNFRRMVQVVETGQPQDATVHLPAGSQPIYLHTQYNKLHDGVVLVHENITARLLAEQEVLKNLRLLEQSEQVAQLGSWVCELATGELRWSAGMYRLFGLAPGTPASPTLYLDYALPDDQPVAARVVQALTTAPADLEETLHLRVQGEVRTLRLKAVLVRDEAGHPLRLLGVDLDISRVQRLEADNLHLRLRQQQSLFEAVQAAQEEERRRISESLHNGIGQLLYATKLQLDRLPDAPAASPRREAARLLGEAMQQTRTLSHELTPAILEEFGLEATLQGICQSLNTPTLRWRYYFELEQPLPLPLQLAVYRLAQELAQNVLKHACATEATLEVEVLPAWVVLRVEDNGRGFDPARTSDGLGWRALRSRVALLGGSVHLTTAPGQGTQCQLRLPLAAEL